MSGLSADIPGQRSGVLDPALQGDASSARLTRAIRTCVIQT